MDIIYNNIATAQQLAMIAGAIAILTVVVWAFTQCWGEVTLVAVVLLAVHPAWTVSAVHGDCGILKVNASVIVTVLTAICLVLQVAIWLWPNPEA